MDHNKLNWDVPEFEFPKFKTGGYIGGNPRRESIQQLQEQYKEEYEKLKMYSSFDRTLRDIEALPETRTNFGD